MEKQEKYFWLNEYLDSVEESSGFMDLSTLQPTSWRHFQPLIAKEWLEWFEKIIQESEKQNVPFSDLAKVFEPDMCREHLWFTLEDMKSARWPMEKRLKIAEFFYELLRAQMPQGDLFGKNGTTRRHTSKEIEVIRMKQFQKGTPELAREFGKLYNGAYNLGAALYLDFYMGNAIENWGPYPLSDGKILVIKTMRRLRPIDIWPAVNTKYENVVIYAVYENVKFKTDLIACHSHYEGDVIAGLREWRLEADGKEITDLAHIQSITKNLGELGGAQWINLTNLNEQELLKKAVEIRCYCFKEVCKLLGISWKPSDKLMGAIKGKTLEEGWKTWKHYDDEIKFKEYWRKIWDPRIEFYP